MNYFSSIINYTEEGTHRRFNLLNFSPTRSVEDAKDVREHWPSILKLKLMEYVDYETFRSS